MKIGGEMRYFRIAYDFDEKCNSFEDLVFEVSNNYKNYWNSKRKILCIVSEVTFKKIQFLLVSKDVFTKIDEIEAVAKEYFKNLDDNTYSWHIKGSFDTCVEIGMASFKNYFESNGLHEELIPDREELLKLAGIYENELIQHESIYDRNSYKIKMGDEIIEKPEMDRILENDTAVKKNYLPVNYAIFDDDEDTQEEIIKQILYYYYENQLLSNPRVIRISTTNAVDHLKKKFGNLRTIEGGVLILDIKKDSFSLESVVEWLNPFHHIEYAKNFLIIFNADCSLMNSVMKTLKDKFKEMVVVPLQYPRYEYDKACQYFEELIKKEGIRISSRKWRSQLKESQIYQKVGVRNLFYKWLRTKYAINKFFPAYTDYVQEYLEEEKSDAETELNKLIGLAKVKQLMSDIIDFHCVEMEKNDETSFKGSDISMHMIFTGNPGTAKTTVARIYARILKEKGILRTGKLIEVGRSDLVGKYVGWTARNVKEYFEKATGSVLFIDEAYSLCDSSDSFGDEAINTIVQEMENHRNDVVVILAGYKKDMERLLLKNEGLRSRIPFSIQFDDYNMKELYEILLYHIEKAGYTLIEDVSDIVELLMQKKEYKNGNGRSVRNIFEKARILQAKRLMRLDKEQRKEEIWMLKREDFYMDDIKKNSISIPMLID